MHGQGRRRADARPRLRLGGALDHRGGAAVGLSAAQRARADERRCGIGGKPKPLSKGEIAARAAGYKPNSPETWRAWEYWATRAGCGDKIGHLHDHGEKK